MGKLYEMLCDILDDIERKEKLTASDLQLIDWATHSKKSILAIEEMEGGDGYSGNSYRGSYRDGSYRGMSNARKRDSMGRYSRDNRGGRSSRGYSRDEGKQDYIEQLHDMMEAAPDDQTRMSIQRMINQMEAS